eukprot:g5049.t1
MRAYGVSNGKTTPLQSSRLPPVLLRNSPRSPGTSLGVIGVIPTPTTTPDSSLKSTEAEKLFEDFAKGFQNVSSDSETSGWISEITGEIPSDLQGTLLRNGPALFERNGVRKEFLDGDGMITSIAIKNSKAFFRNKFVRTESFNREEDSGRFMDLSIFTAKDPRPALSGRPVWKIRLFDDIFNGPPKPKNNGAFNAWHWGGSLVAVDFGQPFQLDKNTLETVDRSDEFSKKNFTAHSRIVTEDDGTQRLVGFLPHVDWASQTTTVTFYEFGADGTCLREKQHQFKAAYFHDLVVTKNWYILFDCPIKMDYFKTFVKYPLGRVGLGDTVAEDRKTPPVFRLFPRRHDGEMITIPVVDKHCYAYHHVNGFDIDEAGNQVVFDTCTWDNFTLYFKDIVEPDGKNFFPRTELTRFTIDIPSGEATSMKINGRPCEYPTVAPSATGVKYEHMYMSASAVFFNGFDGPLQSLAKVSYDDSTQKTEEVCWYPGKRKFVGEPIFVPKVDDSTVEDEGWLLVLVHDGGENCGTELAILDAQKIEDGPVALLRLPTYVPMGVHGSWTPDYILGPNA